MVPYHSLFRSGAITIIILLSRYLLFTIAAVSVDLFQLRVDSLIQLDWRSLVVQVEICRGALHRYASLSTLEIYEAIYKLAVIVSRFGTKLSSKSKRLPAFIKHQANPGNRPLATFPPLRRTTRRSLLLPLPSPSSVSSASTSASVIRLQSHCASVTVRRASNLPDLSTISENRAPRRLVFPEITCNREE